MKIKPFFPFLFMIFILVGCTSLPSGNDSQSAPESSSSGSSAPESSRPEVPPAPNAFTWILEPSLDDVSMLPLRDSDQPGRFAMSPLTCFSQNDLLGLRNQSGTVLLPAEYIDICYSRSQGGLIALKEGSTSYQRLNNKYEPIFDVEYDTRALLAETPYRWDSQRKVIVDRSHNMSVYEGTDYVIVRQSDSDVLYAIGNADGLTTEFAYSDFGPTNIPGQFFLKDKDGWHLLNSFGDDLLGGIILAPRQQRQFSLEKSGASVTYIEAAPYPCSEGFYALSSLDGLWGFYDASGNPWIDFIFEDACPVSFGAAWVCQDGKWGLIQIQVDAP